MPTIWWHLGHSQRSKPCEELCSVMREPHLSHTSRWRVGVLLPLVSLGKSVPMSSSPCSSRSFPEMHLQHGLSRAILHLPIAGFRMPISYAVLGLNMTTCYLGTFTF